MVNARRRNLSCIIRMLPSGLSSSGFFSVGWLQGGAGAYKLRALQAVHRRSYCQQHLGMDQRSHADRHRDHHVVGADDLFAITKEEKENVCV